jgi:hypothetical protein
MVSGRQREDLLGESEKCLQNVASRLVPRRSPSKSGCHLNHPTHEEGGPEEKIEEGIKPAACADVRETPQAGRGPWRGTRHPVRSPERSHANLKKQPKEITDRDIACPSSAGHHKPWPQAQGRSCCNPLLTNKEQGSSPGDRNGVFNHDQ